MRPTAAPRLHLGRRLSDQLRAYGSALDSVLTLSPYARSMGGTLLKLVHDGFRSPQNDAGFNAMSSGWGTIVQRIDAL